MFHMQKSFFHAFLLVFCTITTPALASSVVEFYNTNLDHYFITADSGEHAAIDGGSAGPGWIRTGNSFLSGGNTSVCRFYGSQSPGPNSHFYTVDADECAGLMQQQATIPATVKRWNFESLDFISTPPDNGTCSAGTVPVYRAYNNGFSRGVDSNHRISSSLSAIQDVVARGWANEGVVMCAPVVAAPTISANAVISQSGGQVTLDDGTTASFVAGIVKDGTNVTITSTAQPPSVPTQEVQALSPTVVMDIPPDSLIATAPAGSAITIEIPVAGSSAQKMVASLSIATTKAGALGAVNDVVKVVVQSTAGEIVTYYAPLILKSPGKIVVSIGIDQLCKTFRIGSTCLVAKVTVGAMNSIQCTQQSTSLYQVNFLNGIPVFDTNIRRNGKPSLILVHGWQELGIIGMSCNKPYSSTWEAFLKEYSLDPEILDKFQVFSLAYSSSNPVFGVLGSDFARIIGSQFGQEAVYVVAHSMGGLVARSALVNHGANIGGLVTLATPHHGSPVASQEGVELFGGTLLFPLIDFVIGGPGIMDLAWDNFDHPGVPYHDRRGNVGNPPLEDLNEQDSYHGRYVVFAGVDKEPIIGAIIQRLGYDNDTVVPVMSALFKNSGNAIDSRLKLQKSFVGVSHFGITSDVGVLSETRAALLGFLAASVVDNVEPVVPPSLNMSIFNTNAGGGLMDITLGPDGNIWFTDPPGQKIGRATAGVGVTEFSTGITNNSFPHHITSGPDGNLWFTEAIGNRIGRITPAGVVTEFSAGITAGAWPNDITSGPDGNLWFTEANGKRIGRITPAGVITEFSAGITSAANLNAITAGPDGNLWFTELIGKIGRITPAGVVTEFSAGITAGAHTGGITAGPDGNLWFTEGNVNRIGRITPAGVVTEFSVGITTNPGDITAGSDGNLWFTEHSGKIGRITPAGVVTEFAVGTINEHSLNIMAHPDGTIWFTETSGYIKGIKGF